MRTAKAVANYFLGLPEVQQEGVSPLKLQKLVYIAHGWHLALSDGDPLVQDERAEAWQYGPVFPSLYHEFKDFGGGKINRMATELVLKDEKFRLERPVLDGSAKQICNLLDQIWQVYGKFAGSQLSRMTHSKGAPWDTARQQCGILRNAHIANENIQQYYQGLMEERRSA